MSRIGQLLCMAAVLLTLVAHPAEAADWVTLQATEAPNPRKAQLRMIGFFQGSIEGYAASPVDEAELPDFRQYAGQYPVFNTVNGTAPWGLLLRRVRAGLRGLVPGSSKLSVNLSVELGTNPLTLAGGTWKPKLLDASITYRLPAGLHIRVGRFKAPLADGCLEAVHVTSPYIRFPRVVSQLLMERDAHAGFFTGTVDGFRDIGAQLAGSHLLGKHELSWAVMGATATVEPATMRMEPNVAARVQVSRLFDLDARRQARRPAAEGWVFTSWGLRDVGDTRHDRLRTGIGGQLRWRALRVRTEAIYAHGMLVKGVSPPFAGNDRPVATEGMAWGITALAMGRFAGRFELGGAYSHLDREVTGAGARRVFRDVSLLAEAFVSPKVWFLANLGLRFAEAPEGSPATRDLLRTQAPYLGVQVTAAL